MLTAMNLPTPVATVVLLLLGACQTAVEKKSDKDLLQGRWFLFQIEVNGEVFNLGETEASKKDGGVFFTVKNNTVVRTMASRPGEKSEWIFLLDEEKTPRTIDFIPQPTKEQPDQPAQLRIYKLTGDTFVECYGKDLKQHPKEFSSKEGQVIMTWKREK